MNPDVPQCKNCWKWGHTAGICHIQGAKYIKCNGLYQTIHHCQFAWCCKANDKINSPRLETKKGNPCPHSFKCSNCKGKHQADSTNCLFWKHRFNKEWHSKEYAKLWDNQKNSIRSAVNSNVMMCVRTNLFLFLLSIFLNFIFFYFYFIFLFIDNEEACDCSHMTCHMM